jgi:hypothetical protein
MQRRNVTFPAGVNVSSRLLEMAGFQVSINGRFWVSTEGERPELPSDWNSIASTTDEG